MQASERLADVTLVHPYASIEAQPPIGRRALVEARLTWAGDTLAIAHVRPKVVLRVRDLGLRIAHAGDLVVARGRTFVLPSGIAVPEGHRMAIHLGHAVLRLSWVDEEHVRLPRVGPDSRAALGVALAAAIHLVLIALFVHGQSSPDAVEESARDTMKSYLAAAEERARLEAIAAPQPPPPDDVAAAGMATPDPGSSRGKGRPSEEGTAGNPSRTKDGAQMRITKGSDARAAKPDERARVTDFGLLAILGADTNGQDAGTSPWAVDTGRSAMGNIFGATIHDAAGQAGLGLSGAGEGGGGKGSGVSMGLNGADGLGGDGGDELGLGRYGTIGKGGGSGTCGAGCAGGFRARLGGEHRVRMMTFRTCGNERIGCVQVNGRLPPEAIQRVVRQNHGRIRGCYQQALYRDPGLSGRVEAKFVIDRSGAVAMAMASGDMPDESVKSCVARAFQGMDFPQPEGGIVTVVYPFVFSNE